jgi:multidrug efflux pump subunit AcrB
MALAVALPLEKQLPRLPVSTRSDERAGNTNITLQFDLSRNIDAAAQDVQAMIAKTAAAAARWRRRHLKVNRHQPVMFLAPRCRGR